ncbi:TatD family hydrolase [uncultured Xylophilus sp.]|uniref:TatD family hydrolase n=1 Tax=uncultured Xylophilus sp. TaxID=296832 RepID=UPI0025EA19B9|nr:TatD family hydrolase [uncultured Xylophilus sp.]
MTGWIDTHCHLDAPEFAADGPAMRHAARSAGVGLCVVPAVAASNFDAVRGWAEAHGDAYALGIHPLCSGEATDVDLARLESELAARIGDPRLVAVGEIGLDYFVAGLDDTRQQAVFRAQLRLARRFDLPVLLHVRRSVDRVLRHLREQGGSGPGSHQWRGIAHAFNGSLQQAQAFVDLGLKLGFGGTATFDRALQVRRVASAVPLASMVVETDAPDIPPHWLYRTADERGAAGPQARNSPVELPRIGAAIAGLRGMAPEAFAAATTRNALDAMPRLAALAG